MNALAVKSVKPRRIVARSTIARSTVLAPPAAAPDAGAALAAELDRLRLEERIVIDRRRQEALARLRELARFD